MEIIGIAGALFLLIAWLFETIESVKNHKSLIDLRFAFIYITGIALLAIYASETENPIFFWLNGMIFVLVLFEIIYTLHFKIMKEQRKRRG